MVFPQFYKKILSIDLKEVKQSCLDLSITITKQTHSNLQGYHHPAFCD